MYLQENLEQTARWRPKFCNKLREMRGISIGLFKICAKDLAGTLLTMWYGTLSSYKRQCCMAWSMKLVSPNGRRNLKIESCLQVISQFCIILWAFPRTLPNIVISWLRNNVQNRIFSLLQLKGTCFLVVSLNGTYSSTI